jgi:dethiobiotin synthetase
MAAEALKLPGFTVGELVGELDWPEEPVAVGLVEMAGGVRSPQAADGDATDVVGLLGPDVVVLVGDAGLGTINGIRMSMDALLPVTGDAPVVVVLDRYDPDHDIHRRNRVWLIERLGYRVVVLPGEERALGDVVTGTVAD